MNIADGFIVDDLPFDIPHRHVMTYELADGVDKKSRESVKKTLVKELMPEAWLKLGRKADRQQTTRSPSFR